MQTLSGLTHAEFCLITMMTVKRLNKHDHPCKIALLHKVPPVLKNSILAIHHWKKTSLTTDEQGKQGFLSVNMIYLEAQQRFSVESIHTKKTSLSIDS